MIKKQFYDIKYPFVSQSEENYFVDLNEDLKSQVKSLIMHIVFTPKGQKIRDPEFGTHLVRFLYEPNDNETLDKVKTDIINVVSKYVKYVTITNIDVLFPDENMSDTYIKIEYVIKNGIYEETDSLITKI